MVSFVRSGVERAAFSHKSYVARSYGRGRTCSKIGVSSNPAKRTIGLRKYHGFRFEIVREFDHEDPFAIEAMVKESLGMKRVAGHEAFSVAVSTVVNEITAAMGRYDRWNLTRSDALHWDDIFYYRESDIARMRQRFRDGASVEQVAREFKCVAATVRKYVPAEDRQALRRGEH